MNKFEDIKKKISPETLSKMYLEDNCDYEYIKKYFNITGWTLDKLLREYNLKKSHKQYAKKAQEAKYKKYGGKDAYDRLSEEHRRQTIMKKYGSFDNYINNISNNCHNTWMSKPLQERLALAQQTLSHGGGWNKETATKTLQDKDGVDNASALATYTNDSKVNIEFENLLKLNNIKYRREFHLSINGHNYFKYDFKVNNILIELDPTATHNSTWSPFNDHKGIDKKYHQQKSEVAKENGYRCIHVFDWDDINKIILLLKDRETIYARKTTIKLVSLDSTKEFINQYHLQGYAKDAVRLGLYYQDKLVSIMTFGKPRYNKHFEYELIRYCSCANVIGGAQKLFKYFIDNYNPKSIISYCDNSKFDGKVYKELNFKLNSKGQISCHWYNIKTKEHYTDNLIRQQGFSRIINHIDAKDDIDYGTNNNEVLMLEAGFVKVYDCGQSRYEWSC